MNTINELTGKLNAFSSPDNAGKMAYFIQDVNADIRDINDFINKYNSIEGENAKIEQLDQIEQKSQLLLNKYPANLVALSADFSEEIQNKLFNIIKNERALWGRIPMDYTFAHLIKNMPVEKVTRLMDVLQKGSLFNPKDFIQLYSSEDEGYNHFQNFLDNSTQIKFLGGGNSLNFKIKYLNGESYVLKLENRLDKPLIIEDQLKSGVLQSVIPTIHTRRQATFTFTGTYDVKVAFPMPTFLSKHRLYVNILSDKIEYAYLDKHSTVHTDSINKNHPDYNLFSGINNTNLNHYLPMLLKITDERKQTHSVERTINRSLVLTDFCSGGDLQLHGKKITSLTTLIKSALTIYQQMGNILINLSQNGYMFPDMKNTNWLIDNNEQLKIVDTKSFLSTNELFNAHTDTHLIHSNFMSPPEIRSPSHKNETHFNSSHINRVDKMHSYMLGKNLYQYLTDCKSAVLAEERFTFNNPVFKTVEGKKLQSLIESMVLENPDLRPSMNTVVKILKNIQLNFDKKIALDIQHYKNNLPKESKSEINNLTIDTNNPKH